jgi:hypothetical protein
MRNRYDGGCHCGLVRYMVSADLDQVITCNCTHCSIKSLLLVFVPSEDFRVLSGQESLCEYRFNQKTIAHLFCSHCGVESYALGKDKLGKPVVAVNVRTLEGVDVTALKTAPFDGLHLL